MSGQFFLNIFLNDLEIEHNSDPVLFKYADDSTLVAPVWYNNDASPALVNQFLTWSNDNSMSCNPSKRTELTFRKKYNNVEYAPKV